LIRISTIFAHSSSFPPKRPEGIPYVLWYLKAGLITALLSLSVAAAFAGNKEYSDTTLPLFKTLFAPLIQKAHNKQDSLRNSVNKNINKGDSLVPKSGSAHYRREVVSLNGALPNLTQDSIADPAPTAIAWDHGTCKGIFPIPIWIYDSVKVPPSSGPVRPNPTPKVPFLQIHGNILYDVNYYSEIDTPYNEKNVYQHTVQTYLDILVKGQYPLRIYLTNHFSNSPLFRNFSDFNFSYTNTAFNQQIKDQVRKQYLDSLPDQKKLDSMKNALNAALQKLNMLNGWMNNPGLIQKLVEAREKAYYASKQNNTEGQDSSKWPSGLSYNNLFGAQGSSSQKAGTPDTSHLDSVYIARRVQADSLRKEISALQQLLSLAHQSNQAAINQHLQDIQKANSPDQMDKEMKALHVSDSSLPKGYKTLMAIKSFSVGRSIVNYSELSAKNISINGLQAEYNPSNYYALATGAVDYRFRDFLLQGPEQSAHQYMNVLRYGRGLRDGNSVILTYYQGRRQLYNASSTDSGSVQVPSSNLMGLTLEGNYRLTKNILFTGEVAKSSVPTYVSDSTPNKSGGMVGQMLQMNDRSNEAYSIKANAFFPATQTRIMGSFKHMGENFQSFSVFTDGSVQTAWKGSLDQLLFHKQLDVAVAAYTNDFSNPYINEDYKSTTVFKSIQATLRKRNWPVLSLGYFPSSQITKLGNGSYMENLFYTMVGNATYSYSYHRILMNTTLVYTQFYNRSNDSGFVYFNTKNLLLSQSVFLNHFTLQGNASAATNQQYDLYTLEAKVQHTLSKNLSIGAGVKYNDQTVYNISQWGYSAELTWRIGKLGQIQFSADKGFIPGMNNQLVPNNTGRLTYFKTF